MTRRYALRDNQWERIKDLLPGRKETVGVTAKDNRLFVEAVLYRYRVGIPWGDLPERFGDFRVVHTRFSRGAKHGVWHRVFEALYRFRLGRYPSSVTFRSNQVVNK
jgi:transposase